MWIGTAEYSAMMYSCVEHFKGVHVYPRCASDSFIYELNCVVSAKEGAFEFLQSKVIFLLYGVYPSCNVEEDVCLDVH